MTRDANRAAVDQRVEEALATITSRLGDGLLNQRRPLEKRVYLEVAPAAIRETATTLFVELGARFQTASAVDAPKQIEILYHWALDWAGMILTVRTRIDRDQPSIDSISEICPAAEWIEREMWELMGITFHQHPDPRHLLLQDDWPEGTFPLRRDFKKG